MHTIPQEWNQKNVGFFNVPKIGNLYYMNTDQLQYINNHIAACKIPLFFFEDAITSKTLGG